VIGKETYEDCRAIHGIRNEIAHNLNIDSFDHHKVKGKLDALHGPSHVKQYRFPRGRDKFMVALQFALLRMWDLTDKSERPPEAPDAPIVQRTPPK
jgi:hypothetical protein